MNKRYFLYKDADGGYVCAKPTRELTKEDKIHSLLKSIVQLSEKAKIETAPFSKEKYKEISLWISLETIEEIRSWVNE